jgi:hypothetical protein
MYFSNFQQKKPNDLTPFTIIQKHRPVGGNVKHPVSWLWWIELHAYGQTYRLGMKQVLTVNNVPRNYPFEDEFGVKVVRSGGVLALTAPFGVRILFNGNSQAGEMFLCNEYAGHVCGLLGNADGKGNNDFVDRNNVNIPLTGRDNNQKYFNWGTKWRSGHDEDKDIDGQT